jgi:hypothetical protein
MRILKKINLSVAVLLLGLILGGGANVATADVVFVSGDVSGVWSADSVIVTDSIYVSPGNSLEIEPGVHVLFLTANYFRVKEGAILHAVGTEADTIKFLPAVDGYNTLGIDFEDASDESIVEYCYFTRALYSAIALTSCNMTIRNCLMEGNFGYYRGGGISALEGSDALIENNIIRNNETVQQGGGIYCDTSSPIIRGNMIEGNTSGPIATGGGISCNNHSHPLIVNNTFANNQVFPSPAYPATVGQGAAIYCSNLSNPVITGNLFFNNRVNGGGAVGQSGGGAIFVFSAVPEIENNVFAGNTVEVGDGGALYLFIFNGSLVNNVFVNNTAADNGGAVYMDLSHPSVINSVFYDNYSPDGPVFFLDRSSDIDVTYSDVEGGWEGEGNIDIDPLFRDPGAADYHLMAVECGDPYDSPCIDAGSPDYADSLLDCSWGLGTELSDMGAFGGGQMIPTAVDDDIETPSGFFISTNYPNPFNASTTISYQLPQASVVTLEVYDMLGRKVETLIDNRHDAAGEHHITWDASDNTSGLYFYRLEVDGHSGTSKMLLLK